MSTISKFLAQPPDNFSTQISSATVSSSALSVVLDSTSGLPTEGVGQLLKKNVNGDIVAGSVEYVHWTNVSGNTITFSDTGDRGITGSDSGAQSYVADDYFEVWVSSYYAPYAGLVEHNADGTHKSFSGTITGTYTLAGTPTITSPTVTTPTLTLANATSMTTDGGIVYDRTNEKLLLGDGTNTQALQTGSWTSFNPTVSGAVSAIGNATLSCYYTTVGKLTIASLDITFGSSTSFTAGNMTITLPTNTASFGNIGTAYIVAAGSGYFGGFVVASSSTIVAVVAGTGSTYSTNVTVTNAIPGTFTTNDKIQGIIHYQST